MANKFFDVEKNTLLDHMSKGNINNPWAEKKNTPLQAVIKSLQGKKLHKVIM